MAKGENRCTAKAKGSGERCKRDAAPGAKVCASHGGKARQVRAAGKVRVVEERARHELHQLGLEGRVDDPLSELATLAGEVVAFKDMLREKVRDLDGILTYWQEKDYDLDPDGFGGWTKAQEDVRAVVAAYERALDRTAKVLATMVKLDLQGRLVAIREEQATVLVAAIRDGLGEVDMGMTVRRAAEAAISERLAALAPRPAELPAGA